MASDNLFLLLSEIRAQLPEVSDAAWDRLLHTLAEHAGGNRLYVPRNNKRSHLEVIAAVGESATTEQLSKMLGVSVRRVRQLKQLMD